MDRGEALIEPSQSVGKIAADLFRQRQKFALPYSCDDNR
jgi:hypothetical protein